MDVGLGASRQCPVEQTTAAAQNSDTSTCFCVQASVVRSDIATTTNQQRFNCTRSCHVTLLSPSDDALRNNLLRIFNVFTAFVWLIDILLRIA